MLARGKRNYEVVILPFQAIEDHVNENTEDQASLILSSTSNKNKKHTTARIRMWSPTILLTGRRVA